MSSVETARVPPRSALFAWMVHALTASSALLAFLALVAIEREAWRSALLWIFAALVLDGIDGTLARLARVKINAARIDGDALDLIVDYLTYVFVPTVLIWRAGLIPANAALWLAALIFFSSLYLFVRSDMKTEDNYFRGFPALWNIIAFYLFIAQPGPVIGAVVVVLFCLLTFAPVLFVHPFRVPDFQPWVQWIAVLWAGVTAALLWPDWSPSAEQWLLGASLAGAALLVLFGASRTIRGPSGR
jgi:phosphatidylcholine synthase